MGKKIKTTKQRLKYGKKNRNTKRKYKKQNTKLFNGGDKKEQQNRMINSIFETIRTCENIGVLRENLKSLCSDFRTNIVDEPSYEFEINIRSFIVTSMLIPYMIQERIYDLSEAPIDKFDELRGLHIKNVYFGKEIKEHGLTSLTPYPLRSLELLNSCKDEEEYCVMDPKYLIIDSKKVKYLCNSENIDEIIRIKGKTDLSKTESGRYLYCILPDKTLCIFKGNHSAGACGQPVICAGNIDISDQKIKQIDNSSGHYSPPKSMLLKAIEILETNGLVMKDTKKYNELSTDEIIKVTFADTPSCETFGLSIFNFCM
jgi:hypothetical protein